MQTKRRKRGAPAPFATGKHSAQAQRRRRDAYGRNHPLCPFIAAIFGWRRAA